MSQKVSRLPELSFWNRKLIIFKEFWKLRIFWYSRHLKMFLLKTRSSYLIRTLCLHWNMVKRVRILVQNWQFLIALKVSAASKNHTFSIFKRCLDSVKKLFIKVSGVYLLVTWQFLRRFSLVCIRLTFFFAYTAKLFVKELLINYSLLLHVKNTFRAPSIHWKSTTR